MALSAQNWFKAIGSVACALAMAAALRSVSLAADSAVQIPAPLVDALKSSGPLQSAVLAGGCFWGVQGVFEHVKGVRRVVSGYAGGNRASADYESVSTGSTGHAESVQIDFDPKEISYGQILQIYFSVAHDPTELNRQGPDTGTQYRSSIFYSNDAQKDIAKAYVTQLDKAGIFAKPIVTKIDPLKGFYPAESYHQDFLINNPRYPYIVYNDLPKIDHLKQYFPAVYVAAPVTVTAKAVP